MANPWQALNNTPSFSVDTMMLLTDASIMCHELESPNWHRLVPDAKGNCQWHAKSVPNSRSPVAGWQKVGLDPTVRRTGSWSITSKRDDTACG